MGNKESHHHHSQEKKSSKRDEKITEAFGRLTSNEELVFEDLKYTFGEELAVCLWDYLSADNGKGHGITVDEFEKKAHPLLGENSSFYTSILKPEKTLIKVCSESAGVVTSDADEHFRKTLEEDLKKKKEHLDIHAWVNQEAPRLCEGVQFLVQEKLCDYKRIYYVYESNILTPLEMWFVKCSLPVIYFPKVIPGDTSKWTSLYSSAIDGISINRFDANVIDYRGPTVAIFQMQDKSKFILASDQEWRHSGNRFGGVNAMFMEVYPRIMRIQDCTNSIYCNFKMRAASMGLSFKEIMQIDKDMSNVEAIEVWGCSSSDTLNELKKLKDWQGQQAERNKKVPLPGNWDDNPDKTILQLAGHNFSNEKQLMEMEAKRRQESQGQ